MLAILFLNNISAAYALVGNSTINSMSGIDGVSHNTGTQTTNITTNNAVDNASINWQTLNIGKTETLDVNFTRGSQTLLNNVISGMTTVAGKILSSGVGADTSRIIIANPNGILLEKGSYVNTNALMLTTSGVTMNGKSIELKQNQSKTAPNCGIIIKGKIDSGDLTIVSRGIVLDGADIFANGDVKLITAEGTSFTLEPSTNKAILASITPADAITKGITAASVKYADKIARADNITLKSNAAIKSKDGKIYLTDQRMNAGGINVSLSTLLAQNGIYMDSANYTKIATLTSDANTSLNIKAVANPYVNTGVVSISGVDTIKGINIQSDLKSQPGNYFTEGQSATLTSVKAKDGGINIDGFKKVTVSTSESIGNIAIKGATDISVTALKNEAQTDLQSKNSTTITSSFLRNLFSDTNKLTVSKTQLDQVSLKATTPTSTIAISTLSGYADKNNTVALDTTGDFASASVAANTGHSLNIGNIKTSGNIALSAYDIKHNTGSTLKSSNGTVALTAANSLNTSNIDSYGNVTLKGKDITGNNASSIKSANGSLSLTATNNLDVSGTDLTSSNGTISATATNSLKTSNINSYGNVALRGKDIKGSNGSSIKSKNGSLSLTATNNLDVSETDLTTQNGTVALSATNSLKTSNINSYGNITLTGKDVNNTTKSSITSANGGITATASNFLQAFNLKAAQNIALKGNNLLIVTNASTPKDITLTSTYKANIHQNNVTAAKITLSGSAATPPSNATQIEADRLAKVEADRPAAEKAEADRLAKIEADRLAKIEADRIAEEARLAKIEADRLAKIEADRIAEEARLAKIAEDARLAKIEADRLAKIEADRIAEEARLAKIAEDARLAKIEADRLAKIEADRIAEEARLAKIEADRLAKIAEDARLAKIEADRLAKIEADRIAEEARLAKIAEDARLAKIEADRIAALDKKVKSSKDEINKVIKNNEKTKTVAQQQTNSPLVSQLAQNVKSLAANEQPTVDIVPEARVIQKTATGFNIVKKIVK